MRGFTLIELLLAIGIIAALAVIVIAAVSPSRQFTAARDAERRRNARELQNAQFQYLIDNRRFAGDKAIPEGEGNALQICRPGQVDAQCINVDTIIPSYLACIPYDGKEENPLYTGYQTYQTAGRVHVRALYLGFGSAVGGCETSLMPVAYWKFDEEGIGATALDSSGYGHHGASSGFNSPQGPSTAVPPVSFAFPNPHSLSFDGSNDRLSVTTTSALNINQQFTLTAWIYLEVLGSDREIFMRSDGTGQNELNFAVEYPTQVLAVHIDGTRYESVSTIPLNQWVHVAGARNGVTLKVYVNGVVNATLSPGTGKNANFGSCNTLHIGADVDSGGDGCTTNLGDYWRGRLDDVRIYDRALTDAQIAAIAAGSL